jgi:hypothetical protein
MNEDSSQISGGRSRGHGVAPPSARPSEGDASPAWPKQMRCDVIDAPMEVCCGVFEHLSEADVLAAPTAYVGDRFLFLVSEGSNAQCQDRMEGLPVGLLLHESIGSFPAELEGSTLPDNCWVLPPGDRDELPHARAVLAALRSAYLEYGNAKNANWDW